MRKVICTLGMLVAVVAAVATSASAATGGGGTLPSNCRYTCSCSGTPLRCCTNNGVETCSPTAVIQCPQVYNC